MSELARLLARGLGEGAVQAALTYLLDRSRPPSRITLADLLAATLSDMERRKLRRAVVAARARYRARG